MVAEYEFTVRAARWEDDAAKLTHVREHVFIVEQKVPAHLEWDGLDPACAHVLAEAGDGFAIAAGRLSPDGRIGRMAVLREWRGKGVGSAVVDALVTEARRQGFTTIYLHAQMHAQRFYAKHGLETVGAPFDEAGIPHIEMIKRLPAEP